METAIRKPFQGVFNIVKFNWHFYLLAAAFICAVFAVSVFLKPILFWVCVLAISATLVSTVVSLAVSYYVYDYSGLYNFTWLNELTKQNPQAIVNIHSGLDEASGILKKYFPNANLQVFDFYDPKKHTEISIVRAREAYPPYPDTVTINTEVLPLALKSTDMIFNILALHEIRNREERISFLKQQGAALTKDGYCVVMEHLRDVPNFLAYSIGSFHFFSKAEWIQNFSEAGFAIEKTFKVTPFISVFILKIR
jgi:hypothetical protein